VIPVPSGVRVWLAVGHTDMRRGMNGLALQVQEALARDPHAGDLYVFRGRRGDLVKILWHDGLGMSLYAKRLERGRFIWPSPADGVVSISGSQLAYMLEGIDWRNPQHTYGRWPRADRAQQEDCAGDARPSLIHFGMTPAPGPDDVETLRAALAAEREARIAARPRPVPPAPRR
jgi:transposase